MACKPADSGGNATHAGATRWRLLDAGMVGALVFIACLLGVWSRPLGGFLAAFWPANALLLGILVRYPRLATRSAWIAAVLGYVTADLVTGSTVLATILLTAANLTGVFAGYALYARVDLDHRRLGQPLSVLYMVAIAAAAAAAAGLIGAVANPILFGDSAIDGGALWFISELAHYLAILPVILAMPAFRWPPVGRLTQLTMHDAAPALALAFSCLAGLLYSGPGAMAFPVPALLWCATVYSLFTTACLTLVFIAWTLIAIATGWLPISRYMGDMQTILSVRVSVTLIALAPIVVASLMAARSDLLQLLKEKNAKLADADRAKDRFLAMMSHELRTPMTGVSGMADLLIATGLTPEQEKFTRALARSARTMLSLLNDILDFSKIEAGKLQIEQEPFLLSEALYDVKDLFTGAASEKGLTLQVNLPSEFQDAVVGDAVRLRQVLSNLIGNAIKFTNNGYVLLDVKQDVPPDGGLILRISVRDTGIGISRENVGRLFQPFSQADSSITRRFGGTGLGLAISRSLVRAMGGEIEVTSTEGIGTTFSFFVRVEQDRDGMALARSKSEISGQAENVELKPCRILLGEDNATTRMLISTMLQRRGHTVHAVGDGAAAVAAAEAETFDIILIDMHMPLMDGVDAVKAIRQTERTRANGAHVPLIALTADVRLEGKRTYLEAGVDSVAAKPVVWDALFAEMKRLVAAYPASSYAEPVRADGGSGAADTLDIVSDKVISELRVQLGDDVFQPLLNAFIEETSAYREQVSSAIAGDDLQAAKCIAHALKGASESLGALRTGALARAIEHDAKTIADAAAILPCLMASIDAAHEILNKGYRTAV